jgi:Spy/CpxP family protein refolding chaperone
MNKAFPIAALLIALVLPTIANAADEPDPFPILKSAVSDLNLSGPTKTKVDKLLAQTAKDIERSNKAFGDDHHKAWITARDSVRDASGSIAALLDDDQKLMFKTKLEAVTRAKTADKASDDTPGNRRANPPAGRLARPLQRFQQALKSLDLTEDQKPKVEKALTEARKKLAKLAPNARPAKPSPELREEFRAVMEDLRSQLAEILTPEQREKLKSQMQK